MKETLKTSEEWYELARKKHPDFVIMDPDGWDRMNYHHSFHVEKISQTEFWHRVMYSTCQAYIGMDFSLEEY
jgi:hypothetical protein